MKNQTSVQQEVFDGGNGAERGFPRPNRDPRSDTDRIPTLAAGIILSAAEAKTREVQLVVEELAGLKVSEPGPWKAGSIRCVGNPKVQSRITELEL